MIIMNNHYQAISRELNRRPMYEYRCDERLEDYHQEKSLIQMDVHWMWIRRVYYESMKRKLLKPMYECRCNGRLQTKSFTRLAHMSIPCFCFPVPLIKFIFSPSKFGEEEHQKSVTWKREGTGIMNAQVLITPLVIYVVQVYILNSLLCIVLK